MGKRLPTWNGAVIDNDRQILQHRQLAAFTLLAAPTRAREAAPIPARSDADRPAPAGSAALRLLADVDSSFSRNWCWQIRRWTLALGRPAPMLTAASPGRGGGDGAGAAASYRVIGNDRKFRSTDSGGALLARSAGGAAARKDQRNLAELTIFAALTRARDLLGPPGRCSGLRPHDGEVAGGAVAISF